MVVTARALLQAVERNDVAELRRLVKKDAANINGLAGKTQLAPLHVCAVKNRVECAKVLLKAGANCRVRDEFSVEPVHYASSAGAVDVLRLLQAAGADMVALDNLQRSPLECAVKYNRLEAAKAVLACSEVDVNTKNKYGGTSLHQASDAGNEHLVGLLLEHSAAVNGCTELRRTPLHFAAQRGHTRVCQLLLAAGADANARETKVRETPLHRAAAGGTRATVEVLLQASADKNALDQLRRTPLHNAAQAGNTETVAALIAAGTSTGLKDKHGKTATDLCTNAATRMAFNNALKSKQHNVISLSPRGKAVASRFFKSGKKKGQSERKVADIQVERQRDALHLRSVLQAIKRASEDSLKVATSMKVQHEELSEMAEGDAKAAELRASMELELKDMQLALSEIVQTLVTTQDLMESCGCGKDAAQEQAGDDELGGWSAPMAERMADVGIQELAMPPGMASTCPAALSMPSPTTSPKSPLGTPKAVSPATTPKAKKGAKGKAKKASPSKEAKEAEAKAKEAAKAAEKERAAKAKEEKVSKETAKKAAKATEGKVARQSSRQEKEAKKAGKSSSPSKASSPPKEATRAVAKEPATREKAAAASSSRDGQAKKEEPKKEEPKIEEAKKEKEEKKEEKAADAFNLSADLSSTVSDVSSDVSGIELTTSFSSGTGSEGSTSSDA